MKVILCWSDLGFMREFLSARGMLIHNISCSVLYCIVLAFFSDSCALSMNGLDHMCIIRDQATVVQGPRILEC